MRVISSDREEEEAVRVTSSERGEEEVHRP